MLYYVGVEGKSMSFNAIYDQIMAVDGRTSLEERRGLFIALAEELLFDAYDLRGSVQLALRQVPDEFFMDMTLHRYAAQEIGDGGLMRHTARVLKAALIYFSYLYNLSVQERATLISAALLHDTFKNWDSEKGAWGELGNRDHAAAAETELRKIFLDNHNKHSRYVGDLSVQLLDVLALIGAHTHRFDPRNPQHIMGLCPAAQVLVISDYFASQFPGDI
jgi:hypothetical protein